MAGYIHSSYKGNTCKKTVIEYVEDDLDELPDSKFSKATARVFDKYIMGIPVSFRRQILLT